MIENIFNKVLYINSNSFSFVFPCAALVDVSWSDGVDWERYFLCCNLSSNRPVCGLLRQGRGKRRPREEEMVLRHQVRAIYLVCDSHETQAYT